MNCDRCGAVGKARWTNAELDLIFCGHHDRENTPALVGQGFQKDYDFNAEPSDSLVSV